tara:strand:+ start:99 stop:293 length:195 start_codon:yes stop_codon:yes gene_type:complete
VFWRQACLIFSNGHPWHAKAVDDGLETLQGRVKVRKGKRWNERDVLLHTACAPLFDQACTKLRP